MSPWCAVAFRAARRSEPCCARLIHAETALSCLDDGGFDFGDNKTALLLPLKAVKGIFSAPYVARALQVLPDPDCPSCGLRALDEDEVGAILESLPDESAVRAD